MEEKWRSVLHAASSSRTWSECSALNHYDLLDIRRSHASFCNNPPAIVFFFFLETKPYSYASSSINRERNTNCDTFIFSRIARLSPIVNRTLKRRLLITVSYLESSVENPKINYTGYVGHKLLRFYSLVLLLKKTFFFPFASSFSAECISFAFIHTNYDFSWNRHLRVRPPEI